MICPGCDQEAQFAEHYGPYDGIWLVCNRCGHQCDEMELRLANLEPETEMVQ